MPALPPKINKMLMPHLAGPEVLAALGEISVRHGYPDLVLRRTIKTLAQVASAEVDKALARSGATEMRDMVERQAKRRLGIHHAAVLRLKVILYDCERVTARRNRLTHGPWAKFLDGGPVLYLQTGETLPMPSAEELHGLAREIYELAFTLDIARLEGFLREALEEADPQLLSRDPS